MRSYKEIEKYLNDVEPILIDLKIVSKYLGTLEKEDEKWASKHGFFYKLYFTNEICLFNSIM